MRCASGTARSASPGSSSSPIQPWPARLTCSISCARGWWSMASAITSETLPANAPPLQARKVAPYLFLGQTTSLCEVCLELVPAKILAEHGKVFFQKRCREHGVQKTLIADDVGY